MTDFSRTEEERALQETARSFPFNDIRPRAKEIDWMPNPEKHFPRKKRFPGPHVRWLIFFSALLLEISLFSLLSLRFAQAAEPVDTRTAPAGEEGEKSATEVNKALTNPVGSLWSLSFQQNNYYLDGPDRWQSNLQFQPTLPVALTNNWFLMTRPVFQLYNSTPYSRVRLNPVTLQSEGDINRTTTLGDTICMEALNASPALAGNWLLGFGPTFIFPTATSDYTGQGKWQAGPAGVIGYMSKKWILALFPQQWWSFAGDRDRPATSHLNLQPIASHFFGDGWSVAYSGNILADWKAKSDNVWTVPVGLGVSKVEKFGKFPVKLGIFGQYMPIHPDDFGQKWNIQVMFVPVIPKLIKGNLLSD